MFRRRRPPAKLRPALERSERVLAWARTAEDPVDEPGVMGGQSVGGPGVMGGQSVGGPGVVVVTTRGLWLPGRPRLGWHEIHKATWAGSRLTVLPAVAVGEPVAVEVAAGRVAFTVMADAAPVTVHLADPGDVPHEVRQRVTRSVAYTAHHPLPTGGLRVVGRRVAGRDGLAWHVRYDEGTDTSDPTLVIATAELVAEAAGPGPSDA